MSSAISIAIVGATGIVGTTLLSILAERKFPVRDIFLLSSKHSLGQSLDFNGKAIDVTDLAEFDFSQSQLCFFCVDAKISEEYVPKAVAAGNIVIDKSSHYRYDPAVPLVVPEVNPEEMERYQQKNIIASPNCITVPIVVAVKRIYDAVGISRLNASTYQSVSGSGKKGISELSDQTSALLNAHPIEKHVYPDQIAFNVIPHIDVFHENGFTEEEMKIIGETHKILKDNTIAVNPLSVRVPVFFGHSISVYLETREDISLAEFVSLLKNSPGVTVMDGELPYTTPVASAAGTDAVFVGRIRQDLHNKKGFNLWVLTDNVRKGAALNAVQIAEKLQF